MDLRIPNPNPIPTRLPYRRAEQVDFKMYTHRYHPRSTTLAVAITSSSTTAWMFGDATFLIDCDILRVCDSETGNAEYIQIDGETTGPTTANVIRGVLGTTAQESYATETTTVTLIGHPKSGFEVSDSTARSVEGRLARPSGVVPASM